MNNFYVDAFYSYEYPSFNMKQHFHKSIEILYIENGKAKIEVNKEKIILKKRQYIVIDSKVSHALIVQEKCKVLNLELSFDNEMALSFEHLNFPQKNYLFLDDSSEVCDCIKRIHFELTNRAVNKDLIFCQTNELFLRIAKAYSELKYENVKIKRVIDYINTNYTQPISIAELSALAKLNHAYLQREFKKNVEITIGEYITSKRLEKAKKMLQSTTLPIIDIAIEVGYNSRQNFYHAFKQSEGISPSDFVKNHTAQNNQKYIQTPYEKG